MDRRAFLVSLAALYGCGRDDSPKKTAQSPLPESSGGAPPGAKPYRIGWLAQGAPPSKKDETAADFEQALRELGYAPGTGFVVEYRYANGAADRLSQLASELVRLPVDVIVTSGEPAAMAAKRATSSIPIVAMEFGIDPNKAGLVASLGRPEANVTGLLTQNAEMWQKRLDVFKKQTAPAVTRAAVLWNPANPDNVASLEVITSAAPSLGLRAVPQEVRDSAALERAFVAIAKERPDAIVTCWDDVTLTHAKRIAEFALTQRMPTLAPIREYVAAGSLISLGINLPAHVRKAAYYVDKLLKGAKAGSLPVELPRGHDLVINVATAKSLGMELQPNLLLLADELIR